MHRIIFFVLIVLMLGLNGCATTSSKSVAEKRQAVLNMKSDVLSDLYRVRPDVKSQIARSPGYAVFYDSIT